MVSGVVGGMQVGTHAKGGGCGGAGGGERDDLGELVSDSAGGQEYQACVRQLPSSINSLGYTQEQQPQVCQHQAAASTTLYPTSQEDWSNSVSPDQTTTAAASL